MTCPFCDQPLEENTATCPHCGGAVQGEQPVPQSQPIIPQPTPVEKPENILNGIIGAIGGACLGGALIVLMSRFGLFASLCGAVIAVCALKGYEFLGGRLSKTGIVTSIVLLCIVPAVAYFLSLSISLQKQFPFLTLLQAFKGLLIVMKDNPETMSEVIRELLILYLFTALGAFSAISSAGKKTRSL